MNIVRKIERRANSGNIRENTCSGGVKQLGENAQIIRFARCPCMLVEKIRVLMHRIRSGIEHLDLISFVIPIA